MDLWQTLFSEEHAKQLYFYQKEQMRLAVIENKDFYRLEINGVIQSAFANSAPYMPALPHCAVMLLPLIHDKRPSSILELGGGGQAMQRYFSYAYPQIKFTSVEADKDVYNALSCLPGFKRLNIQLMDAFAYIDECVSLGRKYDWVMVDLFNGSEAPVETTQSGFYANLNALLKPNGWLIVNGLTDEFESLKVLQSAINKAFNQSVKAFAVPGQKNHIFLLRKQSQPLHSGQSKEMTRRRAFNFEPDIEQHNLFKTD